VIAQMGIGRATPARGRYRTTFMALSKPSPPPPHMVPPGDSKNKTKQNYSAHRIGTTPNMISPLLHFAAAGAGVAPAQTSALEALTAVMS
jgi:hypothetical protein